MTDFKCQLKSFLLLSFGLLFSFITTPSYAIEASDEFEIQYSPPFLSDGMPISLKGKWKVWTHVGEPAKEIHVLWKNNDFVIMGGEYYGPGRDECYSVPQSVLNEVSLINLKLKAKVAGGYQQQSLGYYMIFDAGSMKKAAGPDTYSEKNFTVSGIKNWDELFIVDDLSKRFASEDTAKRIIKAGLKLGTPEVDSVGFNLGPVRDWVRSCEREKEKAKKALEKKLVEQVKADQQNDFDRQLRQLAAEQNELEQDESSVEQDYNSLSFDEQLHSLARTQNTPTDDVKDKKVSLDFDDKLAALPKEWEKQKQEEMKNNRINNICNANKPIKPDDFVCERLTLESVNFECGSGPGTLCLVPVYTEYPEPYDEYTARCDSERNKWQAIMNTYNQRFTDWENKKNACVNYENQRYANEIKKIDAPD